MPISPYAWSEDELRADSLHARSKFRRARLAEGQIGFQAARPAVLASCQHVIPQLLQLLHIPAQPNLLVPIFSSVDHARIIRCISTPPISEDDFETLVQGSITPTSIARTAGLADQIAETLAGIVDPIRFPWIALKRPPTAGELAAATLATSTLAVSNQLLTLRRMDERIRLEKALHDYLATFNTEVPARAISATDRSHAPAAWQFMRNAKVGSHGADAVVGLPDSRLLLLECKASNSEINSRKRLNKEVAADARSWRSDLGEGYVVPAAVISGVFKVGYLQSAQDHDKVALYWGHRLQDIRTFIDQVSREVARPPRKR